MLSCATSAFGLSAQKLVRQGGCRTGAESEPWLISQLPSQLNKPASEHALHNGRAAAEWQDAPGRDADSTREYNPVQALQLA